MPNVILFLIGLCLLSSVLACNEDGSDGFVPKNDIYIPVDAKRLEGISESEFNGVITKIKNIYAPVVSSMGGRLIVNRRWKDGTANANATRIGSRWNVNMYGGLARHESMTADGFALVLCHEIGHHIGGAPKISFFFGMDYWASNEGQADYFATLKCLRHVFQNDHNASIVSRLKVPEILKQKCTNTYSHKEDQLICIRSGMAGNAVAHFFAAIKKEAPPQFDTPDPTVVPSTYHSHPPYQCRLDTYLQGAICDVSMNEDVSQEDEVKGTCHGSLGNTQGLRPNCWFKPTVI